MKSAAGGGAGFDPVGVPGIRRLRRHPRQHVRVRRSVQRRRPPPRRPAARRRPSLRSRNLVRGIGQGRGNVDPDSAPGNLREVQRIGRGARLDRQRLPAVQGPGTGPLPAGLLHRRAHLPPVPRRRQDHHQAVRRVPRRRTHRPRPQDHRQDSGGHRHRPAAAADGRRRSRIRRRPSRPSLRRRPRARALVLPARRHEPVLRDPGELHHRDARRRNPGADARRQRDGEGARKAPRPAPRCA